jgi:hypothetical protein
MNALTFQAEFAQARAQALQTEARERALVNAARSGENPLQALLAAFRPPRQPRLEVKRT